MPNSQLCLTTQAQFRKGSAPRQRESHLSPQESQEFDSKTACGVTTTGVRRTVKSELGESSTQKLPISQTLTLPPSQRRTQKLASTCGGVFPLPFSRLHPERSKA